MISIVALHRIRRDDSTAPSISNTLVKAIVHNCLNSKSFAVILQECLDWLNCQVNKKTRMLVDCRQLFWIQIGFSYEEPFHLYLAPRVGLDLYKGKGGNSHFLLTYFDLWHLFIAL